MFDAMADWMAVPLLQAEGSGANPPRLGLHHPSIAPYGAYRCGDGLEVLFSIQNPREWRAFCAGPLDDHGLTDDRRFADPAARTANRAALDTLIDAAFGAITRAEVIERLEAARIAYATVNTALELGRHPHLRRLWTDTPGGSVGVPAPPARRRGAPLPTATVPALDEQDRAIRREFADEFSRYPR